MIDGDFSVALGLAKGPRERRRTAKDVVDPLAVQAEALQGLVKSVADKPKPRDVHHLRTTIRRFETLLPERDGDAPRAERKLAKQLDKIRKRAGKVRDADVHLRALATIARTARGDDYDRVRRVLEKRRTKQRKRLVDTIADHRDRGLLKRLRQVVGHADAGRARASDTDVLARVLQRFGELWPKANGLGEQNLHEFRMETKRLRYLAETAAADKDAAVAVAQLKRMQDAAGAWHDWTTLGLRAAKEVDGGGAPLLAAIAARTAAQLQKALATVQSAGRRLMALKPAAARKPARPMSPPRAPHVRNAGASA
jgi:CHAD domain-containing protein